MLNQVILIGTYRYKTEEGFVMEVNGDDIYIHDSTNVFYTLGAVETGRTIAIKGMVKGKVELGANLHEEYNSVIFAEKITMMTGQSDNVVRGG